MSRRRIEGSPVLTYFIQIGEDGPVKIGHSTDVYDRLGVLLVGLPLEAGVELRVIGVRDGKEHEKALHGKLAAHRIRGEWFRPVPEVLAEAAASRPLPPPYRRPKQGPTRAIKMAITAKDAAIFNAISARESELAGRTLTKSEVFFIILNRVVKNRFPSLLTHGST